MRLLARNQAMTKNPFHGASTEFRPFEPEHIPSLKELLNQSELRGRRYLPEAFSDDAPLSTTAVEKIVSAWNERKEAFRFGIFELQSESLVGHAGADWGWDPQNPSLYVVVDPAHHRNRIGSEAAKLLLRYLLENSLAHCLTAWIADWNNPAIEFAEFLGFTSAGRMRRAGLRQGKYFDYVVMDMLRVEAHAD
jgi:RimJ/RimL family protein N-acetyltransferase